MGNKVLIIGQGAREHAIAWKLSQSPEIMSLYAAPGNPGIASAATCIDIAVDDIDALLKWALENDIDLTVVGPEVPLTKGIVDRFRTAGLNIFGPTAAAAQIESSKAFAKQLFKKYGIPTAEFEVFTSIDEARKYAHTYTDQNKPVVVKADGLAAGKGVIIANDTEEAETALNSMLIDKTFGGAGNKVVIEEFMTGEEVSYFVICNGSEYISIMSAQDHKRIFDQDKGPNTGGMGAYVNPPFFTKEIKERVESEIIMPVIKAMELEGCPYQGVLYAGLMLTADGPKVLEFNARFGDPETQVLMPMLKSDLYPVLLAASKCESFAGIDLEIYEGSCLGVVLASGGYPDLFAKGLLVSGLNEVDSNVQVFHAATKYDNGQLVTNGGRVFSVVSRGSSLKDAAEKAYAQIPKIVFKDMHYRKDIGARAIARETMTGA